MTPTADAYDDAISDPEVFGQSTALADAEEDDRPRHCGKLCLHIPVGGQDQEGHAPRCVGLNQDTVVITTASEPDA